MKIILVSSASFSVPVMHNLAAQGMLIGVVTLAGANKNNIPVEMNAKHLNIPYFRFAKRDVLISFKNYLADLTPDLVLVFGCGFKLPSQLFGIPKFGFYNVHFSLLPAYRGKTPVFWQLKNGEEMGGITIHQMAEDFDTGPMLMQQEMSISPGDTLGLYSARLAIESAGVILKGIEKLNTAENALLLPQNESAASHYPPIDAEALKIDWETQSAKEIESLVNACNPDYGGAITLFRGQPFRILEANQAQVNTPGTPPAPGTIVHSDTNYGVFVACKNSQFLRLNIVQVPEGIFSGFKLSTLGITAGERFENAGQLLGIPVNH